MATDAASTPAVRPGPEPKRIANSANRPLWRLGAADDTSKEFSDYARSNPERVRASGVTSTPGMSKGLNGAANPALEISYDLAGVPRHGVEFRFKLLHAHKGGPQMAVFSNAMMAGLIQLWGTADTASPWPWRKTYRLYIPAEMLAEGGNTLRLEAARPLWSDASVDRFMWWEWDYVALDSLGAPAREPVHGTVTYLGTTVKHSDHDFKVDDATLRLAPVALKWMGVAHGGNTVRADFWWDVAGQQPRRREFLELLRDLNMTVIANNVSSGHFRNDPDGSMPKRMKDDLARFFQEYGALIQWYEIANEPCMFGGGYAETVAIARCVNEVKPAHVTTTAPGWAYGGGKGTPTNWSREARFRRDVEALCQATNGHSYGFSYADNEGGSFVENLETFEGVADGWPVEYVNTETGANNWHSEENGPRFASSQPHAQAFDRIIRAHVAVVDRSMQHAAIFGDFGLFNQPTDWGKPETLSAFPGVGGEDCRLKTFRRLALAYATHGAPLPFTYASRAQLAGKKVYVRVVDTRALPALPGSGGISDKVLLNFINFELETVTVKVRIEMPARGAWTGERIGAGRTFADALSDDVRLWAAPELELDEVLEPGESTQYVLTPPEPGTPYAPMRLTAEPDADRVTLSWAASSGATTYVISRATSAEGVLQEVARDVTGTTFVDTGLAKGAKYWYVVAAANEAGTSGSSGAISATVGAPRPTRDLRASPADGLVTLRWAAGPGVTAWRVMRASEQTGPFAVVARDVSKPEFVDRGMRNGRKVWYAVVALNDELESVPCRPVAATPQRPPAAPTGLTALAGNGRILLTWSAVRDATGYNVKRAANAEGPFESVGRDVGQTRYCDDVTNGATYHYAITALKGSSEGLAGEAVSASASGGALPAGWKRADIGSPGKPGVAAYTAAGGVYTVSGSGHDIWDTRDGLHYVYRSLAGDGALTARVRSYDDTHTWAKIGLMVRASLAQDASMAIMAISPGKGCGLTFRQKRGGTCDMRGGDHRQWLRIQRSGNRVVASVSLDGKAWKEFGAVDLELPRDAMIGLGVCSHDNGRINTSLFDSVTVSGEQGGR